MLEALRKHSASIFIKILFGLLILSFLGWGVGDFIRGRASVQVVAEVGDVEISPQELDREYRRELVRMERLFGQRLDREQAKAFGLVEATLNQIITNTLWNLGSAATGATASDAAVRANISKDRTFMDQTGKFDRRLFEQALQSYGFTEKGYTTTLRQRIARAQIVDSIMSGAAAPKALVEAIYRFRQEKRVVETFAIADSAMTAIPEPTADELAKFHADHPDQFSAPEYRAVTVLGMKAADLVSEVAVTDEEIKDLYDQRQADFDQPEVRKLRQIVVPDEAKAKEASAAIEGGRDFTEVAKDVAGMDAQTTEIGEVRHDMLLTELADAAFALPMGGISKPVQSPLGWHILKVESVTPAQKKSLEDVRSILKDEIAREKSIDALFNLANRVEDALGGGATLEEAAKQFNLEIRKVSAVDATGHDPEGKEVADLPTGGKFIPTVFETPETEDSLLTEAGNDGYFVLRVDKVTPSRVKGLDEVRSAVVEAWKAEQRADKAKETAEAMAQRIDNGESPEKVAADVGAEVKTTEAFTRMAPPAGVTFSRAIVEAIFKTEPGKAVSGRGGDGYVVARIKEVIPANPGTDPAGMKALADSLGGAIGGDVQSQFVGALHTEFGVSINQNAIDKMF